MTVRIHKFNDCSKSENAGKNPRKFRSHSTEWCQAFNRLLLLFRQTTICLVYGNDGVLQLQPLNTKIKVIWKGKYCVWQVINIYLSLFFFVLPIKVPQGANNLIQRLKWLEAYKDTCKKKTQKNRKHIYVQWLHGQIRAYQIPS